MSGSYQLLWYTRNQSLVERLSSRFLIHVSPSMIVHIYKSFRRGKVLFYLKLVWDAMFEKGKVNFVFCDLGLCRKLFALWCALGHGVLFPQRTHSKRHHVSLPFLSLNVMRQLCDG